MECIPGEYVASDHSCRHCGERFITDQRAVCDRELPWLVFHERCLIQLVRPEVDLLIEEVVNLTETIRKPPIGFKLSDREDRLREIEDSLLTQNESLGTLTAAIRAARQAVAVRKEEQRMANARRIRAARQRGIEHPADG